MSQGEKLLDKIEYSSNQKDIAYVDRSGIAIPTKKVLKVPSTKNKDLEKTQHVKLISTMSVKEILKNYVR